MEEEEKKYDKLTTNIMLAILIVVLILPRNSVFKFLQCLQGTRCMQHGMSMEINSHKVFIIAHFRLNSPTSPAIFSWEGY